jgi:lysyl-tRNA synthetase class 2
VKRTHEIGGVLRSFGALSRAKKKVFVAGRVMGLRDMGNVIFADIADASGKIQAILKKDRVGGFALLKETLDRGDFVSVGGKLVVTKTKEKSIEAQDAAIIAKSLRPLPDKWAGLEDEEIRFRKRYLDFLAHPEAKELFQKKARFWEAFRDFLKKEGFLEVEMSALEPLAGGANAQPFVTHHHALGADFYLRIALELPLKKLLVGGYEKVFEIGRVFRNEGIDREHLQDYAQLEFYWAYRDMDDLMAFVEKMYKHVIRSVAGSLTTIWQGHKINWGKKWPKIDYGEAFRRATGVDLFAATVRDLAGFARSIGLEPEPNLGKGHLIDIVYKKTVRPKLIQPAFLINPPAELVPLAKRIPGKPAQVMRMQPVSCGTELGNGFAELNDPIDQRLRFEEQARLREAGDAEAQPLDEDYLEAMEYGMPPAAGFGVSERLFAVLMNKPVRDTTIFPLMRKK